MCPVPNIVAPMLDDDLDDLPGPVMKRVYCYEASTGVETRWAGFIDYEDVESESDEPRRQIMVAVNVGELDERRQWVDSVSVDGSCEVRVEVERGHRVVIIETPDTVTATLDGEVTTYE